MKMMSENKDGSIDISETISFLNVMAQGGQLLLIVTEDPTNFNSTTKAYPIKAVFVKDNNICVVGPQFKDLTVETKKIVTLR
jgi:hypothetical protein